MELLERQLKHDTESSKLLSNEKQLYLKQISDLEQQVLNFEEDNIVLKNENVKLNKCIQEINLKIFNVDKFNMKCENELKLLIELINKEQLTRNSFEQSLEMIEYNVKKYKYLQEKNTFKQDPNLTLSKNNSSWQERRSARVDKQELLTLQLELKSEISDKQKIQGELTKLQQDFDNVVYQMNEFKNEVSKLKKQLKSNTSGSNTDTFKNDRSESDSEYKENSFLKDYLDKSALITITNKRQSLIGMGQDINENFDYHDKFGHSFIIRTFITPIKCYICTSLMIGLVRQGYVCEGMNLEILI